MGRTKKESKDAGVIYLNANGSYIEEKDFYAQRIKALRNAADMTQAEFAARLGLSRTSVLNWETGRSRPDISNIPALCRELNISVSAFFSVRDEKAQWNEEELRLVRYYRSLSPAFQTFLLNTVKGLVNAEAAAREPTFREPIRLLRMPRAMEAAAAGTSFESYEGLCEEKYVHDTPQLRSTDILFHINGDSMEPDYPNHCTVAVRLTPDLSEGDIGIFSVEGSLYMKELGADGLYSLNPAYQPILAKATGEIRNIGKVTGIVDEQDFATNEEIRMYEAENDARDEE